MTILDILNQLRDTLKKKLPLTLIISFVLAVCVGLFFRSQPAQIVASTKIFPLAANSVRGASSPVDLIRAQFGLESASSNGIFDINELIQSKSLSLRVVNSPSTNKKYPKLYQWIVDDYNKNIPFYSNEIKLLTDKKDTLTNLIVARGLMLPNILVNVAENGYTTITVATYDKDLSREITETYLRTLSEFYIEFVTEKPRTDLNQIQAMRDSLEKELTAVEKAIAGTVDENQFSVKAYVGLPRTKLERKRQEVTSIYSTTVSALQNARFKLLSESPIFQILDYPGEPYSMVRDPWKIYAAVAFFLFFILLSLWWCRHIFKSLIIEELKKA